MSSTTKWRNYSAGLLLAIALGCGGYYTHLMAQMHTRPQYTIGYLTSTALTPKSGRHYNYAFTVSGHTYQGSDIYEPAMPTALGSRVLIEYDSLDPEISAGHFAVAIPDSIVSAPANGWHRPPFPVPASALPANTAR